MAELKKDFGGISSNRLTVINNLSFVVFCLVAWNAGVANAEQVYNVVLRRYVDITVAASCPSAGFCSRGAFPFR